MRFTNFSLLALIALLSVSVNAQAGDDNVVPRPGDDRGTNGTTTTTRPSPTAVPTNSAMKNSMGTLGVASLFAYFLF